MSAVLQIAARRLCRPTARVSDLCKSVPALCVLGVTPTPEAFDSIVAAPPTTETARALAEICRTVSHSNTTSSTRSSTSHGVLQGLVSHRCLPDHVALMTPSELCCLCQQLPPDAPKALVLALMKRTDECRPSLSPTEVAVLLSAFHNMEFSEKTVFLCLYRRGLYVTEEFCLAECLVVLDVCAARTVDTPELWGTVAERLVDLGEAQLRTGLSWSEATMNRIQSIFSQHNWRHEGLEQMIVVMKNSRT